MKIALLLTGNELMSGDTVDSNSALIARSLAGHGFDVDYKITVGDQIEQLVFELHRLSEEYGVVIVNGGLGPTVDDLTAEALSRLCGEPLLDNKQAHAHLEQWCTKRGYTLNASNLKQALLPATASVLANPVGSAVGIQIRYKNCLILCTPGVPGELTAMLKGDVVTVLKRHFPEARSRLVRRLKFFGIGESTLQQILDEQLSTWKDDIEVGFRAGAPLLELKLAVEDASLLVYREQCEVQLRALLGDYIVGEDDDTLTEGVIALLRQKGKKLALAESCTGGAIAAQITSVPGASEVFEAGIVSYSNAIKESVLRVPAALLDQYGAVSREVVLAMAKGALACSGADCVVAVSGIAGPDGGTVDKPVGSVWIAWGSAADLRAQLYCYNSSRKLFQTMVSAIGLDLLRRYLLGSGEPPNYYGAKQ